jgi:hypothetical protein
VLGIADQNGCAAAVVVGRELLPGRELGGGQGRAVAGLVGDEGEEGEDLNYEFVSTGSGAVEAPGK